MKNKMNSLKNTLMANKSRLMLAMSGATTALATTPLLTNAAPSDVGVIVAGIADVVVKIFPFIGIFFVVSGVFKLIMAYRNDQPEAQAGAAKDIVIGAVFLVFATFIWTPIRALIV